METKSNHLADQNEPSSSPDRAYCASSIGSTERGSTDDEAHENKRKKEEEVAPRTPDTVRSAWSSSSAEGEKRHRRSPSAMRWLRPGVRRCLFFRKPATVGVSVEPNKDDEGVVTLIAIPDPEVEACDDAMSIGAISSAAMSSVVVSEAGDCAMNGDDGLHAEIDLDVFEAMLEQELETSSVTTWTLKDDDDRTDAVASVSTLTTAATDRYLEALAQTHNYETKEGQRLSLPFTELGTYPPKSTDESLSASSCATESLKPENSLERLPKHLIRARMTEKARSVLQDPRFLLSRQESFGIIKAAHLHVSDVECLQRHLRRKSTTLIKQFQLHQCPAALINHDAEAKMEAMKLYNAFSRKIIEDCFLVGNTLAKNNVSVGSEQWNSWSCNLESSSRAISILAFSLHQQELYEEAAKYYQCSLGLLLLLVCPQKASMMLQDNAAIQDLSWIVDLPSSKFLDHGFIARTIASIADAIAGSGNFNHAISIYEVAVPHFQQQVQILTDQSPKDTDETSPSEGRLLEARSDLVRAHHRMGMIHCESGELELSIKSYQDALGIYQQLPENMDVAELLHNMGVVLRHQNDLDNAMEYYSRALVMRKHVLAQNGDDDQNNLDVARTLHNIGGIHRRQKRFDEAMDCFREVLQVRRSLLGDYHPSISLTLVSMGAVLRRCGKMDEAMVYYEEAMR